MEVRLGASGSAGWNLAPPSSFPHGSVYPTDSLTSEASIPGAALDSWGTPERGRVLRGTWGRGHCPLGDSQHRHLWRKRTMGWVPVVSPGTGQLALWRRGWEARRPAEPCLEWRPGSQGPRTSSELPVVFQLHSSSHSLYESHHTLPQPPTLDSETVPGFARPCGFFLCLPACEYVYLYTFTCIYNMTLLLVS